MTVHSLRAFRNRKRLSQVVDALEEGVLLFARLLVGCGVNRSSYFEVAVGKNRIAKIIVEFEDAPEPPKRA